MNFIHSKPSSSLSFLKLLLTFFITVCLIWAQAETGQITGSISDASGGAVAAASVTVTNTATGAERVTKANTSGIYAVPNLLPGQYSVKVTAPGFSTYETKLTITVGEKAGQDVKLQVGEAVTVVEVAETAAAIKVNTETQTITQTLNAAQLNELPTLGRNPYSLVVTSGNVSEDDTGGNGVGVAINGLRSAGTNVLLDGVANNDEFNAVVGQPVPLDSVQELGITTSNFTAETGRASAGVVNVTTKSGTNAFHGTVYEFNRVSALASNSFFNNAQGLPAPIFTKNNFGYSVGGPVIKNKLFFFNNTEWTRIRSITNNVTYIIDPAYIAASAPAAQSVYSQYGKLNPGTTTLGVYSQSQLAAAGTDPCAGASVGGGCTSYNPNAPMMDLISYTAPADGGAGLPQNAYNIVGRVDYNLNDRTQIYGRYALYSEYDLTGSESNSPYAGFNQGQNTYDNSFLLAITHSFSDHFVSQTKLDFNRFNVVDPLPSNGVTPDYTLGGGIGNYGVTMPGFGGSLFGGPQNFGQLYEDLSYSLGKHEIRFGGTSTYLRDNRTFGAYQDSANSVGKNIGNGLDNLAAGQEYAFSGAINPQGHYPCVDGVQTPACTITLPVGPPTFERSNRYEEFSLYAQDSWKITKRLTFNYGIRWEYFGTQHNVNQNLDSNFYLPNNVGPQDPAFPQAVANGMVQPTPQSSYKALWYASPLNFAPRIGLAWDVFGDGKTSFRGGYGIGYERNFGNVTYNVLFNPPNYAVVNLVAGTTPGFDTIPLSTTNFGILSGSNGSAALPPSELRWVQPNIPQSFAHLISASLEHEFFGNTHLEVDYSASIGVNQYDINNVNISGSGNYYLGIPCTPGSCTDLINNQYGNINLRGAGGHSTYNSMNVRYDIQDVGHTGLTLRMNYTYSHTIDDLSDTFSNSGNQANLGYTDFQKPYLDKGSSQFDNRHRLSIGAIWLIPYAKHTRGFVKEVLDGWELAPVFTARTGARYSIYDYANTNAVTTRVVLNQAAPAAGRMANGADSYTVYDFSQINIGEYVNPIYGDSDWGPFPANMTGRNAFKAPGTWDLDLGMYKNVRITESKSLQLRLEAYNASNHANFSVNAGGAYIDVPGGSSIVSGSYNGHRNVQLGAKFIF
jgi:outer membrane receptor protein involved in Fe transport